MIVREIKLAKLTVRRVSLNEDGQAIVGDVTQGWKRGRVGKIRNAAPADAHKCAVPILVAPFSQKTAGYSQAGPARRKQRRSRTCRRR